jgi:hypothetical protein
LNWHGYKLGVMVQIHTEESTRFLMLESLRCDVVNTEAQIFTVKPKSSNNHPIAKPATQLMFECIFSLVKIAEKSSRNLYSETSSH